MEFTTFYNENYQKQALEAEKEVLGVEKEVLKAKKEAFEAKKKFLITWYQIWKVILGRKKIHIE